MKQTLLLILGIGLFTTVATAQGNPISTAYLNTNQVENRTVVMFEEPVTEGVTIYIKDLTGKTVMTVLPESPGEECKAIVINTSELKHGIYICQISGDSGKLKTLKFQKN